MQACAAGDRGCVHIARVVYTECLNRKTICDLRVSKITRYKSGKGIKVVLLYVIMIAWGMNIITDKKYWPKYLINHPCMFKCIFNQRLCAD